MYLDLYLNQLEKVKHLAKNQLEEMVALQRNIMELDYDQIMEFNKWYKNYLHQQEIDQLVRSLSSIKNQASKT